MKILFDGNVPRGLVSRFPANYQVTRAQSVGWAEKRNGELLRLASQTGFQALVTMDKRMRHEQNLQTLPMPVFVLSAPRQKGVGYLARLIATDVVPLLEQGAENRFYLLGEGHKRVKYHKPLLDKHDDFIREPLVPAYSLCV